MIVILACGSPYASHALVDDRAFHFPHVEAVGETMNRSRKAKQAKLRLLELDQQPPWSMLASMLATLITHRHPSQSTPLPSSQPIVRRPNGIKALVQYGANQEVGRRWGIDLGAT
ncbi:hypothetical protein MHUMG1_00074 [Metarhizium humberi]|uniref:Uncharacterized protein n=1 Tax=Metarhizium humberi TaxID=2596975 RepID=A0A9P8SBJ3_9HYPO|nr:hypothetical protein MHUMG1_00074 [Metarhizium humberi]